VVKEGIKQIMIHTTSQGYLSIIILILMNRTL
jgi:hypothetical protein